MFFCFFIQFWQWMYLRWKGAYRGCVCEGSRIHWHLLYLLGPGCQSVIIFRQPKKSQLCFFFFLDQNGHTRQPPNVGRIQFKSIREHTCMNRLHMPMFCPAKSSNTPITTDFMLTAWYKPFAIYMYGNISNKTLIFWYTSVSALLRTPVQLKTWLM